MSQICRTCFQETSERNYIELEYDRQSSDIRTKIEFCIPEMDLELTPQPVICILCVNLLNSAYTFKKQCLDTEHNIKKYMFGLEGYKGAIDLNSIYLSKNQDLNAQGIVTVQMTEQTSAGVVDDLNNLLDDALSVNVGMGNDIDIEEHGVVKIEIDDDDVICVEDDVLLVPKDSGDELQCESAFKNIDYTDTNDTLEPPPKQKVRRGRPPMSHKVNSRKASPSSSEDSLTPLNCEYCKFTAMSFESLLMHINCHKEILKTGFKPYFCPLCKLRSRWKVSIINHMKIHNIYLNTRKSKKSEKQRAKCPNCSFVTRNSAKWEKLLAQHKCPSTFTAGQ